MAFKKLSRNRHFLYTLSIILTMAVSIFTTSLTQWYRCNQMMTETCMTLINATQLTVDQRVHLTETANMYHDLREGLLPFYVNFCGMIIGYAALSYVAWLIDAMRREKKAAQQAGTANPDVLRL